MIDKRTIRTQAPTQIITVEVTPDDNDCCWLYIYDSINFDFNGHAHQWDLRFDETRKLLDACETWLASKPGDPQGTAIVADYDDFKLKASTAPDAFGCMSIRIEADWRFKGNPKLVDGWLTFLSSAQVRRLKDALDLFFRNMKEGDHND